MFAVGGWVDSRGLMDSLANTLSPHWKVDKYYYADANQSEDTSPPDEQHLLSALNAGAGLVLHAGHGSDTSWEGCFSLNRLSGVKNADRLPIMMSAGCSTARFATLPPYEAYRDVNGNAHLGTNAGEIFSEPPPPPACYQEGRDDPTGLGKELLRRGPDGAVAYIGCDTGSQPCSLTLLAGFVQAIAKSPRPRLGDCWSHAIDYYYEREHLASLVATDDWYPPSIFFQGMKYMVFGDPSLLLPNSDLRLEK